MIYAAQRALGPAAFGQFSVLLGIAFIASVAADFGLQLTTARALAQAPTDPARVAGVALWVRGALALAGSLVCLALNIGRDSADQLPLALLLVGLMLSGLAETCGYILRGLGRIGSETTLLLAMRLGTALGGAVALALSPTPLALGVGYAASGAAAALIGARRVRAALPGLRLARPDPAEWRALAADAGPLGIATLLSIAFTRTPLLALEAARGTSAVAAFAVAQRLTEPLALIPASLLAPVFPVYAAAVAAGRAHDARRMALRYVLVFGAIGTVIAAAANLAGPGFLGFLYPNGEYAMAGAPLSWLALALVPAFVNLALTQFLVARGRTRLNALFTAAQFGLCLGIAPALSGAFGPAGAAMTIAVCEILLLALCLIAR